MRPFDVLVVMGLSMVIGCGAETASREGDAAASGVRVTSGRDADATIWARATRDPSGEALASVRWSPATRVAAWEHGELHGETPVDALDGAGAERLVAKIAATPLPAKETAYTTCGRYFGCEYVELWGGLCNVCSFVTTSCDTGMTLTCSDAQ
jgi:hypothetical protein